VRNYFSIWGVSFFLFAEWFLRVEKGYLMRSFFFGDFLFWVFEREVGKWRED